MTNLSDFAAAEAELEAAHRIYLQKLARMIALAKAVLASGEDAEVAAHLRAKPTG